MELKELGLPHDDLSVVKTFHELVSPKALRAQKDQKWLLPPSMRGLLVDYIDEGVITLVIGDTLFVHGALHDDNAGKLERGMEPWRRILSGRGGLNVLNEVWEYITQYAGYSAKIKYQLQALNRAKEAEMVDFHAQRTRENNLQRGYTWAKDGGYDDIQDGSRLLQYGMGWFKNGVDNKTVIYANYIKPDTNTIEAPSRHVVDALHEIGIQRIVVGHQPNGDCPNIIPSQPSDSDKTDFEVIMGDTSYATNVKYQSPLPIKGENEKQVYGQLIPVGDGSTRGAAVSELLIDMNSRPSRGFVHGILANGICYRYTTPLSTDKSDPSAHIGTIDKEGWTIKAFVPSAEKYVLSQTKGFTVEAKFKDIHDVK